jgi:hypothetical protein
VVDAFERTRFALELRDRLPASRCLLGLGGFGPAGGHGRLAGTQLPAASAYGHRDHQRMPSAVGDLQS